MSAVPRGLKLLRHLRHPGDVCLWVRIFAFALAVPILLRLKLPRLGTLLEAKSAPSRPEPARIRKIVSYADSVLQVGSPLVRPGCLTRGLTLYYFLRRAGLDVRICFGIGTLGSEFVGHCWLVKDGEPFMEARDLRPLFTEVYSFPQKANR